MKIEYLHPRCNREMLGFIPDFLNEDDPRPAKEQFNANYAHGGGWRPMRGWTRTGWQMRYPGDPPMEPLALMQLHDELVYIYPHAWVVILQPDNSFEISRMD